MQIITTTLKYPAAVGEARMLQPAHDDALPGVEPPRMGSKISLGPLGRAHVNCEDSLVIDQMPRTYITTPHERWCMTGGESSSEARWNANPRLKTGYE
jgi:hypothetical protein